MNKLKAIIVDDEESARDVLENLLIRFCPEVTIVAKSTNVLDAVEVIKAHQPDIVFLDIQMPNYAGYEIVNFFTELNFEIIFVTAYDNYAIHAFEIAATDYLLKPIEIDRLKESVARVVTKKDVKAQQQRMALLKSTLETKKISNIIVTDKSQQHIIAIENIIAVEAQESYCIIHTKDQTYCASKNLKHFETILQSLPCFFRAHKSWLINKDYLKAYSKSDLTITLTNGLLTKLSKYKKNEFEALITS